MIVRLSSVVVVVRLDIGTVVMIALEMLRFIVGRIGLDSSDASRLSLGMSILLMIVISCSLLVLVIFICFSSLFGKAESIGCSKLRGPAIVLGETGQLEVVAVPPISPRSTLLSADSR